MNLPEAVRTCFSKYVAFSGRARRSEYWYWALFTFLVGIVASILDSVLGTGFDTAYGKSGGIVQSIVWLATLLPGLGVFWRRMHDIGRSGAWGFLLLIPIANIVIAIILIVWACKDSQPGPNRFGPNPKAIGGQGEFPGQYGQPDQFGGTGQYGQPGQF